MEIMVTTSLGQVYQIKLSGLIQTCAGSSAGGKWKLEYEWDVTKSTH